MIECIFKRCILSFQGKKEGRGKEKNLIKKKVRTQYLITKVWNPAEKLQNNEKTKTNSSRRSERSKINNRNRYRSALYIRGSHEIVVNSWCCYLNQMPRTGALAIRTTNGQRVSYCSVSTTFQIVAIVFIQA